jgi:hypothetical protein
MKSTAANLLFFLMAATSAATFAAEPKVEGQDGRTDVVTDRNNLASTSATTLAAEPKAEAHDGRTEIPTDRSNKVPEAASTPSKADTRKQKRCRQHHKTVGVACRTRASR